MLGLSEQLNPGRGKMAKGEAGDLGRDQPGRGFKLR